MTLLLTLVREPEPPGVDDVTDERAQRWRDQVREHYPPLDTDGTGDVEDYWEMAARLDAALHCGVDVWLHDSRRSPHVLIGDPGNWPGVDAVRKQIVNRSLLHYGPILTLDPLWMFRDDRADRYMHSRSFATHCGRRVEMGGTDLDSDVEPHHDVAAIMTRWHAEGHREVIVKATSSKAGLWRLSTSAARHDNDRTLWDAIDWAAVRLGGRPDRFMVQEVVRMNHEYRAFVVDGEVVTSAGCVEVHTPLLNRGPNSPWTEVVRGDGEVVDEPQTVAALLAKAAQFARDAESEMPRAYVVDVAMGDDGPLVIECNGITNSGLYASDPRLVLDAMVNG